MGLAQAKLLIEAPVNGGRNDNGPKVASVSIPRLLDLAETCVFSKQSPLSLTCGRLAAAPLLANVRG